MEKLLLLLIFVVTFFSCGKEELVYSCDPDTDKWVKNNMELIQTMTRAEWTGLNENLIRPVYRAFTPEQKKVFWVERLNEIQTFDWSTEEKKHIVKFIDFIKQYPNIFEGNIVENDDLYEIFDRFTYEWMSCAEKELGWNKKLIYAIAADGHRLKNKEGDLEIKVVNRTSMTRTSREPDCHCSTSADFCSNSRCISGDCNISSHGCGVVWVQTCDGLCNGV